MDGPSPKHVAARPPSQRTVHLFQHRWSATHGASRDIVVYQNDHGATSKRNYYDCVCYICLHTASRGGWSNSRSTHCIAGSARFQTLMCTQRRSTRIIIAIVVVGPISTAAVAATQLCVGCCGCSFYRRQYSYSAIANITVLYTVPWIM